jgi:hypothetical protein
MSPLAILFLRNTTGPILLICLLVFKKSDVKESHIFVMFGGRVFQQTVDIPMGNNSAPLLAELFLYSYEADFIHGFHKKNEKKIAL